MDDAKQTLLPHPGEMTSVNVLLISTYELGRQPFGLASPAAFLRNAAAQVACLDLSVQRLDHDAVKHADLIALYVPMHTATRIALAVLDKVVELNPSAHICAYGLYAPVSAEILRRHGVHSILGGEFEEGLVALMRRLRAKLEAADAGARADAGIVGVETQAEPEISLARQRFLVPDRGDLPPLAEYAHLTAADGSRRTVGYTEATRGCKHLCRHCPVVPVYGGLFRVVQPEVVLADIEQQVGAGAEHITFGDPDFFNGPKHAAEIVGALHERHPDLTYDVTIKVEHLLAHADLLPLLRDTGCAFVTSAIESVDDRVLEILDKGHTRDDFVEVVRLFDAADLALQPTFVAFTPWITLDGYADLLNTLVELDLIDNLPSIQLAIRLLIPAGSRLLELPEVDDLVGEFDPISLGYPWDHTDPRVDELQQDIEALVEHAGEDASRREIFAQAWELLRGHLDHPAAALPPVPPGRSRPTIPYLSEPWYC